MRARFRSYRSIILVISAASTAPLVSCAEGTSGRMARSEPSFSVGAGWQYEVMASPGGRELAVQVSFGAGTDEEMSVIDGAEPFVRDVEVESHGGWRKMPARDGSWFVPSCGNGCRVRYRYALAAAADARDDVRVARATGDAILAGPSTWLLRPTRALPDTPFRFHVVSSPGDAFASGVFPAPGLADVYEGKTSGMWELPYAAFGRLRIHAINGGWVQLAILPGKLQNEDDIVSWAEAAARAVSGFYGRPTVRRLLVIARPGPRTGVGFGTTTGNAGAAIAVDVGGASTTADLRRDWVLVHEMVHTALPDLLGPHHWLEEGLATYVEPQARLRTGVVRAEQVWAEWAENMPNGLPGQGDRGLDNTPTWGRTYWGGALFALAADVAIRERTEDKKSLGDALRAIDVASGGIAVSWTMDHVIEVGDGATGVPVLRELYDRMANAPVAVDLDATWKRLGVVDRGGQVTFDDQAPLAAIRRSWMGR